MVNRLTQEQLNVILERHKLWLSKANGGEKANLKSYDLTGLDFRNVNLHSAVFRSG